jgi:hypothetical protein
MNVDNTYLRKECQDPIVLRTITKDVKSFKRILISICEEHSTVTETASGDEPEHTLGAEYDLN